jgi:hypothetical protein
MAPEQVRGAGNVDHRADIYSLGAMLYEVCTGKRAFVADGPAATMVRHLFETPPPPRKILPELPERLDAAVMMALSKDPESRFQSMEAFAEALRPLDPDAALARRPSAGGAAVPPLVVSVPEVDGDPSTRSLSSFSEVASEVSPQPVPSGRPPRSQRTLQFGAVGGAAALVAVLVVLLVRGRMPAGSPAALSMGVASDAAARVAAPEVPAVTALPSPVETAPVTVPALPQGDVGAPAATPELAPEPAVVPPRPFSVKVRSRPAGAQVIHADSGRVLGRTPATLELDEKDLPVALRFRLRGFQTASLTLRTTASPREVLLRKAAPVAVGARSSAVDRRADRGDRTDPAVPRAVRSGELLVPGQAGPGKR